MESDNSGMRVSSTHVTGWRARLETFRNWRLVPREFCPTAVELAAWCGGFASSSLDCREPWISFHSLDYLRGLMRPGMQVFEFGCGGSTLFFADAGAAVIAVEHDVGWAEKVREAQGALRFSVLERVPVSRPSGPSTPSLRYSDADADFSDYVGAILQFNAGSFDMVFVDGRARVASALAGRDKLRRGGVLVLDNSERPDYALVHHALRDWQGTHLWGLGRKNLGPWRTSFWVKP